MTIVRSRRIQYAPEIATHYGEVFWTDQGNNALPEAIKERFKGKVIAITGYEQDQVMVTPVGHPGENPSLDVSVPINWAYNHHYMTWMTGEDAEMNYVQTAPNDVSAHGAPMKWIAQDKPSALLRDDPSIPTNQFFSEGNGGESRKSFHGYPDGYAQLVESPDLWHITPMQIDTRNRDCGVRPEDVGNCTTFTPGPEPRQARYGRGIPSTGTNYSGILECPCNGRWGGDNVFYGTDSPTKTVTTQYGVISSGACATNVDDSTACFDAIANLGVNATKWTNVSVNDEKSVPSGCSLTTHADGTASATFNAASSSSTTCAFAASYAGARDTSVGISLSLSLSGDNVDITITGPADVWFGIGLNASKMADMPYTLIVNDTGVQERQIGTCGSEADHCPGDALASSVKIVSNEVRGSTRTVVLTRPAKGASSKHYTFDVSESGPTIPFIAASGSSQTFAYHKAHDTTEIILTHFDNPTCVCVTGKTGTMCDGNGENCTSFVKNCLPKTGDPSSSGDLLAQHNPTCNSIQYAGGLTCCKHRRIMLDADQEIRPELLRYHMKFRFWFQEYTPANETHNASHQNLERVYYQTEAWAGEYDIPPAFRGKDDPPIPGYPDLEVGELTPGTTCEGDCPNGPDCDCHHTITYNWTLSDTRLIYAGGHCHAPSCIGIWLYRNDPGHEMELLCHQAPLYGTGNVSHDKFDEAGYLTLPPCLWSDKESEGLEPTQWLGPNTPLVSIKKNRNTRMGHFGEMASWQMRAVTE